MLILRLGVAFVLLYYLELKHGGEQGHVVLSMSRDLYLTAFHADMFVYHITIIST